MRRSVSDKPTPGAFRMLWQLTVQDVVAPGQEAVGGLGGGPVAGGLGEAGFGVTREVVDELEEAAVEARVAEVDVAGFECRSHGIITNPMAARIELVGNE
jgi:hypothetical protein